MVIDTARLRDLLWKGWVILLEMLQHPKEIPTLFFAILKGAHPGELVRITRNLGWLQRARFNTLIDVGAGVGQFSMAWLTFFPHSRVYAFEPLEECFRILEQKLRGRNESKAFNIALGNHDGEIEFWKSAFLEASSPLKMTAKHAEAFPWSARMNSIKVPMMKLDSILPSLDLRHPVLMKIDVQGYELEVLKGAEETLKNVTALVVETSFEELYKDQPLFEDVYTWLTSRGFKYTGSWDQLKNPKTGEIIQQDAIFLKTL